MCIRDRLGEGRFVFAMALLDRADPVARVVGWQGELKQQDPYSWQQLIKRFPKAAEVPLIGTTSEASGSPEKIVSLKPDVAIFSLKMCIRDRNLGLDDKWAYNIIKQVGNYGESYDRAMGKDLSLIHI